MRFIHFLKKHQDTEGEIGDFARWATDGRPFPQTAILGALEMFLTDKLPDHLWNGFYKAYLTYVNTPGNRAPKEFQNMEAIIRKKKNANR